MSAIGGERVKENEIKLIAKLTLNYFKVSTHPVCKHSNS